VQVAAGRSDRQAVNLRDYGAVDGGSIDAALTAALAALGPNGGVIFIPAGDYTSSAPPSFDSTRNVTLRGNGGITAGAQASTRITFTGTGAGSWLSARSSFGFALEDLQLLYSNAGFTGTLVNLDQAPAGFDTSYFRIERCQLSGSGVRTAARLVSLDKAIIGTFRNCTFQHSAIAVRGRSVTGNYSNSISFYGCTFIAQTTVHVADPDDSWLFSGCTFENLVTAAGAQAGAGALSCAYDATGVSFLGCWFGDSTAAGDWVNFRGGGLAMMGNFVAGGLVAVRAQTANTHGVTIVGNNIEQINTGVAVGATGQKRFVIAGNAYTTVTNPVAIATGIPSASLIEDPTNNNLEVFGQVRRTGGPITDGLFPVPPSDGTLAYDTTNNKLAIRIGGVWKHSAAYT
jgi:hypothetical protein